MAKSRGRDPLLLRVCAEIGAGRITEGYIHDPGFYTDGITEGQHITINPMHQTVDTLLHECIHRLEPGWSERYVRNRTKYLRNRMTDAETQAIYAEYQKRVTRRKRAKRAPEESKP
jgi:hypothetical protein